jgi:ATP-dependent helicase/nuclease subunit A
MAIKNKINRENLSEEMRILYVAMTRAVDKLIIVGTLSKYKAETYARRWHKGPSKYRLLKAESFLDWIGASLFNMIDVDEITEMMSGGTSSDGVWKFSRISLADLIEVSSQSLAESGMDLRKEKIEEIIDFKNKKNSEYSDEIDRRLSYRYSHEKSVNVPTKISVTKLNRLEKESFEKLYVPALRDMPVFSCKGSDLSARKDFSASEKGTLVHFVMQHLDLGKNLGRTGIEEQIADMEHRNLLTTGEAMAVTEYSEKIEEFFLSEIGRRMISSPLVRREVPFVIKRKASDIAGELDENDVVLVQGIVDCLFYEDGEAVIVDYKTDSVTEEEIENVRDEYREQVLSYKDAVEKITHTKVKECSLYLFSLSKTVKI